MHSVELEGQGSPLLLLHGWGQCHQALLPLAELLSPLTRPLLADLPGFGKSQVPETVWSANDYADQFLRFMDGKGIEKFSVLGHSFGGKVAICLALRYPERIENLILIAPSGLRPENPLLKRIKLKGIAHLGKWVKWGDKLFDTDHFAKSFAPRFGSRDYNHAGRMRPILVKSVNEDLSSALSKIKCKTLILWGEKDQETPLEVGNRFARLIPQARFYSFPLHGHYLFQDAGAHLCALYISHFLKGQDLYPYHCESL